MSAYRFTIAECRSLSARAWQIRRFVAGRDVVPLMSVSWRGCLEMAKREQLRAELRRIHVQAIGLWGRREPLVGVSQPMFIPAIHQAQRSSWVTGLARAAVVLLALVGV